MNEPMTMERAIPVGEEVDWLHWQAEMFMAGDDKFANRLLWIADVLDFLGDFAAARTRETLSPEDRERTCESCGKKQRVSWECFNCGCTNSLAERSQPQIDKV